MGGGEQAGDPGVVGRGGRTGWAPRGEEGGEQAGGLGVAGGRQAGDPWVGSGGGTGWAPRGGRRGGERKPIGETLIMWAKRRLKKNLSCGDWSLSVRSYSILLACLFLASILHGF